MFDLLVELGYREIEVGFPTAGADEHDFVRTLIEQDRIPDDVLISVLVPARGELIRRTMRSLAGAPRAAVHVYNATCPTFRSTVFGLTRPECKALAVAGATAVARESERLLRGTEVRFQYSPELFNETEPEFALEVCEAVLDVWQPGPDRPVVLNFPATVERSTPNVFADQIEWLDRNLSRREHICLSVHTHNDRGTGVAAAELAVLAGAQRVEGCLFGGGERAGNACLVTLALNLHSQGVDPRIDFSDLDRVRRVHEECTGQQVPERHPYGGDLVYTAFSGTHQDAIGKGFDAARRVAAETGVEPAYQPWDIPYLPIDPQDVGRGYEELVRITSQSGKGGVAYVMSSWHGLYLPRGLRADFAPVVQKAADAEGRELGPDRIGALFEQEYLVAAAPPAALRQASAATLYVDGPVAAGPADVRGALVAVFAPSGVAVGAVHLVGRRAGRAERDADRLTVYAACEIDGAVVWGVGVGAGPEPGAAALAAVLSALARAVPAAAPRRAPPVAVAAVAATPRPARGHEPTSRDLAAAPGRC
jgi:2-isopropylmalate synthase